MPSGDAHVRLRERIAELAAAHGTPVFPPHLTLVGSLGEAPDRLIDALRPVAAAAHRCNIVLEECDGHGSSFRAFYHRVEPSKKLERLRIAVADALDLTITPWVPHVSLLYGDLSEEQREFLVARTEPPLGADFQVDALHLWSTEGEVATWHEIATLPFGSATSGR